MHNKVNNAIDYFWIGFVVYSLIFTLYTTEAVSFTICGSLQIFGLLLMVPSAILLMEWEFESSYLKYTFVIYIFWLFTVIIRGFSFDFKFIKDMLFDVRFGIFLYLVPFILLFPRNLLYYKKAFNVIVIFGIAYIVYDLLFFRDLLSFGDNVRSQGIAEYFSQSLSLPCGLLLLTYIYHSKKRRLLALSVMVITLIIAIFRARRGLAFMSVSILLFSYFIYYNTNKKKTVKFLFSIILIAFMFLLTAKIYSNYRNSFFGYMSERMYQDTRSGVEVYFYHDMNYVDWIFGKGINGQYYCPGIDQDSTTGYRGVIETGYLQIILKGGLISLGLLVIIAIPAIFKGLFYSKNLLSKAAGIWILLFLIDSYPATITTFTMHYLLVWISIGICYSKNIRDMSESTVTSLLYKR